MFQDVHYSDTIRPSQNDKVLKLKNFKKDASLKLSIYRIKHGMSMSVQKLQVYKMAKFTKWQNKIMLDNLKEDPSDVAIDCEHMDTIGSPDETEEPNAQEPISHFLNTPVDNEDVVMTDAPDTINLVDPPSHESEITSLCGRCSSNAEYHKGEGEFGTKVFESKWGNTKNKVVCKPKRATSTAYIRRSKIHKQGMLSTADNEEVVNEPQLLDSHERNKKKGTLLQDFLPVIGKDGKEIKLEP
uniref:Uncharacterized protein n=1 Tax=Tanacetum cinerariifolium TaxID=118510 RepID=A0A699GRL5_TANCI|nr:hypothetical protein [Tanacetum cinerariifolium]